MVTLLCRRPEKFLLINFFFSHKRCFYSFGTKVGCSPGPHIFLYHMFGLLGFAICNKLMLWSLLNSLNWNILLSLRRCLSAAFLMFVKYPKLDLIHEIWILARSVAVLCTFSLFVLDRVRRSMLDDRRKDILEGRISFSTWTRLS